MSVFYKYFLGQWILSKIDENYLSSMVQSGRITQEEKETIIATPRAE